MLPCGSRIFCIIYEGHVSWVGSVQQCTDPGRTPHNGKFQDLDDLDRDLSHMSVRRVKVS